MMMNTIQNSHPSLYLVEQEFSRLVILINVALKLKWNHGIDVFIMANGVKKVSGLPMVA